MIKQWLGRFTPKQIIAILIMIAVAIYVVWYVIEALEGFDPNYRPYKEITSSSTGNIIKGGPEVFDPTKKTPEASTAK